MNAKKKELLQSSDCVLSRDLEDGRTIAIIPFLFTWGLLVDVKDDPFYFYEKRYCYKELAEAIDDFTKWNGKGDPEGNWIKCKGRAGDYPNPNAVSTHTA